MVQSRGQAVVIQALEAKSMRPQVPEATFVGQRGRREGFLQGLDDEDGEICRVAAFRVDILRKRVRNREPEHSTRASFDAEQGHSIESGWKRNPTNRKNHSGHRR